MTVRFWRALKLDEEEIRVLSDDGEDWGKMENAVIFFTELILFQEGFWWGGFLAFLMIHDFWF